MEVNVNSPGGLRREMRVRVPAERLTKAVEDRLKAYASRAKLPGFRPGKAPKKVIEQQYGPSARMDAVSDLIQQTYPEALREAGVEPAGQPKIDVTSEVAGDVLEYVAHFEVYPEVTLAPLDALSVERPTVDVTEADIDKLVDNLRKARKTFTEAARPAQTGDRVKVDFLGKIDGEAFAGSEGKDVEMELGSSQFLPDLENGIAGHSAGESFVVDVHFPSDYRAENLRDKTAQFDVTLHSVEEIVLPEIDAEFLTAHSVDESEGVEGLRAKCRTALEKERDKAVSTRLKSQVMDALVAANPLELPEAALEQEIVRLRQEAAARMNMANVDPSKLGDMLPAALFEQTARRRVALGLLIGEVVKSKEVKLDAERLERTLDGIAADYEQPEQVKTYYRSRQDLMQGLGAMTLEDQVVDLLVDGAQVSDSTLSLDELLNPQQAPQS